MKNESLFYRICKYAVILTLGALFYNLSQTVNILDDKIEKLQDKVKYLEDKDLEK